MFAAIIVGSLGLGAGVLSFTEDVWCDEITAYRNNKTGLFKWYVIPNLCEEKVDFNSLKSDIQSNINSLVTKACNEITNACDSNPAYVPGSSQYFYCPTAPSCSTTQDLVNVLSQVTVKTGINGETGCSGQTCTIKMCSTQCTNTNLQSQSATAVSNANQANSANNVIQNVLLPLLSCDVVINKLLDNFNICDDVYQGTQHIFAGCCVAAVTGIILTIALFMGQKRYISRDILDDEHRSLTDNEHFSPHEKYLREDRIHV